MAPGHLKAPAMMPVCKAERPRPCDGGEKVTKQMVGKNVYQWEPVLAACCSPASCPVLKHCQICSLHPDTTSPPLFRWQNRGKQCWTAPKLTLNSFAGDPPEPQVWMFLDCFLPGHSFGSKSQNRPSHVKRHHNPPHKEHVMCPREPSLVI